MQTKTCTTCGIEKEVSKFYTHKECKFGVNSSCKECEKQRDKTQYQNNKDKKLQSCKEYYNKNRDKVLLRQKNNPNNRKRNAKYFQDHKAELIEYGRKYKQEHKSEHKNSVLKSKFGITLDQYNKLLELQNSVCAICGKEERVIGRSLAVDHNHKSGKVRGLLCSNCNTMLGKINDNKQILQSAINYLNKE
jgi:hypothetical protein